MQDEKQFEQLMLQYKQLINGAIDIKKMILNENYDNALSMTKSREEIFLNCKCMRRYLDLTPVQEKELNILLDELRELELDNIKKLSEGMDRVYLELKRSQKSEKIQHAYDFDETHTGNIINIKE
ncbi:hypothetical protein IKB17_06755 [bacterium]|nr:hypothetical protein [bacterium]